MHAGRWMCADAVLPSEPEAVTENPPQRPTRTPPKLTLKPPEDEAVTWRTCRVDDTSVTSTRSWRLKPTPLTRTAG